jgi:RND superfamily putative drug exporter
VRSVSGLLYRLGGFCGRQIREHHEESGDTTSAVVAGLSSTRRVITSAALIMVCVFASFILSGSAVVEQFGVGLAAAIAIDATIVRCLFVPAAMKLLGDACWWLPRPLERVLPRMSVEGGDLQPASAPEAHGVVSS